MDLLTLCIVFSDTPSYDAMKPAKLESHLQSRPPDLDNYLNVFKECGKMCKKKVL